MLSTVKEVAEESVAAAQRKADRASQKKKDEGKKIGGQKQDAINSFIQAQAYFNQQKNTQWAQQSERQIQRLRSS